MVSPLQSQKTQYNDTIDDLRVADLVHHGRFSGTAGSRSDRSDHGRVLPERCPLP